MTTVRTRVERLENAAADPRPVIVVHERWDGAVIVSGRGRPTETLTAEAYKGWTAPAGADVIRVTYTDDWRRADDNQGI